MVWATYGLLALAVVGCWIGRRVWLTTLVLAMFLGYLSGVLSGVAAGWLMLMAASCELYARSRTTRGDQPARGRDAVHLASLIAVVVLALLLALHRLPGFHNPQVLNAVRFSADSAPFSLWLNFDKAAAGLLLLGLCYRGLIRSRDQFTAALKADALPLALTLLVLLAVSMLSGYVHWSPKLPPLFWLWAAMNLLFTCMSEEAIFRAFIQTEVRDALRCTSCCLLIRMPGPDAY
jgi:uncharacterized protein